MIQAAVFASGTGSNFEAIADAIDNNKINGRITLVVADKLNAPVIQKAKDRNIPVFAFDPKTYASKEEYEQAIAAQCDQHGVQFLILAGYMRILSSVLLNKFENAIVNIHPSLLPSFKGKDAIGQAIDYGVKIMGVTVHYVDQTLDGGRIITQRAFEVKDGSREAIETQVHAIEHVLYPETLKLLWEEKA